MSQSRGGYLRKSPLIISIIAQIAVGLPPVAHANFWDYVGLTPNQTYQLEFTSRIEAPATYWAIMSCNNGGYGGIQVHSPTQRIGLYSIWDQTTNDTFVIGHNKAVPFANPTFRFGGEGTGAQMAFNWAWLKGKPYRMAWRRFVESDQAHVRYEGWYFDPYDTNSQGWVWVGTIWHPTTDAEAQNMTRPSGFAEVFGGNFNEPREIDIRNVWLLDLTNAWNNITTATMISPVDEAQFWAIPGGWRNHNNDTNYTFSPAPNLAMLPAMDLSPIYLPYRLRCGWWSTDVSASNQVAESLSRAFEPDAFWYGDSSTNASASYIDTTGASNAAPQALYQNHREGNSFGYRLCGLQPHSPNLLRLHFVETDFDAINQRLQDILVNGFAIETNLDIIARAGAGNRALVLEHLVNVAEDGLIDVSFHSRIPEVPAVISGIEAFAVFPQLAWHPQSTTNDVGTDAWFGATAISPSPLSYQWQKDGLDVWGETNASLTLVGVTSNDVGGYAVAVRNSFGAVTSAWATLTVQPRVPVPPTFRSDPFVKAPAALATEYRGSLKGDATDFDGRPLSFAKMGGPEWLRLDADGTYVGTPTTPDLIGTNGFIVRATTLSGVYTDAVMQIVVRTNIAAALWLQFSEGSGPIVGDTSPNGNTGYITGAIWTNGISGNALQFQGVDFVSVPNAPSLNPSSAITVSAWICVDTWEGDNRRILQKGTGDNQYRFLCEYGELKFHLYSVGILTTSLPSVGEWHHVAATYDGASMNIWIDAGLVAQGAASGSIPATDDPLYIGTKGGGDGFYRGTLCDVRLYDRALVFDEIRALYQTDTIGDGIPNVWRQSMFHTGPTTNDVSCADCDPDRDGMNNIDEFLAGTHPLNAASVLKLTSVSALNNGIRMTWNVVSNRNYVIQAVTSNRGVTSGDEFQDVQRIIMPPPSDPVSEAAYIYRSEYRTNPAQLFRVRVFP